MTRRILSIGLGATALSLPACLTVDGDTSPQLRPPAIPAMRAPDEVLQPSLLRSIPSTNPPMPPGLAALPDRVSASIALDAPTPAPNPIPTPPYLTVPSRPDTYPTSAAATESKPAIDAGLKTAKAEEPQPIALPNNAVQADPTVPGTSDKKFVPDWPTITKVDGTNEPAVPRPRPSDRGEPKRSAASLAPIGTKPSSPPTLPVSQDPIPAAELPTAPKAPEPTKPEIKPLPVEPKSLPAPPPLPAPTIIVPPKPELPPDSPLVKIVRAFEANDPAAALQLMDSFEPGPRELLSNLIPPMMRLSETGLRTLSPEEAAILVERLTIVSDLVKSQAALTAGRIAYCNKVERFGYIIEDQRPAFRPGSYAYVYVEIKNFTAEPVSPRNRRVPDGPPREFVVRIKGQWEVRDSADRVILTNRDIAELHDLQFISDYQTPPKDYYQVYTVPVPTQLKPGAYTLWIQVTDVPTGKTFRRPIAFRVSG